MAIFRKNKRYEIKESRRSSTGEPMGLYVDIGKETALSKMQVFRVKLLPGRRSSPPHIHTITEEFVYVLEGRVSAIVGSKVTELRAGDAIGFPAGAKETHYLRNDGNVLACLLVTRVNSASDQMIFKPRLKN